MTPSKVKLACIIDDDSIYINLLKKIIQTKKLCSDLIIFNNGQQSINYFEDKLRDSEYNNIPEIIFLDLNMPIMDGWEFLKKFKLIKNKLKKEVSLYVVSSSINPADISKAKSFPEVYDYLSKPVHIKDLEAIFSKTI
ncbi:response regulator [Hyunsoonleella pacifica]|uniref:Response regulator n=1 Tax=Hyunsoonleella pacifica TaxID=1080224 RepID=A0A4Q9FNV7_9FLAO|nr:response regulator [Hyunsoonleella pacifica]TBN16385.1 response regulator [Hyunsoonleella pacifica]GGD19856.1 response regulator [Hyunsoonleella pacifica]